MVAPAANEALSTLTFGSQTSSFHPERPSQRPRAWERLPKSSHLKRHKGRKVWKRYEPLQRNPAKENQHQMQDGQHDPRELSGLVDSTHAAKRLRSREASTNEGPEIGQKLSRYVTTLRDKASGTPRRKVASRRSLRLDRPKAIRSPAVSVERTPDDASTSQKQAAETSSLEVLQEEAIREVQSEPVGSTEGPLSEHVEESLSSPISEKPVDEETNQNETPKSPHVEELDKTSCSTVNQMDEEDKAALVSTIADPTEAANPARGLLSTSTTPEEYLVVAEMISSNTPAAEHENAAIEPCLIEHIETSEPHNLRGTEVAQQETERLNSDIVPEQVDQDTMTGPVSERGSRGQEPRRSSRRLPEKNKKSGVHSEAADAQIVCAKIAVVTSKDTANGCADALPIREDDAASKDTSHTEESAQVQGSQTKEEDGIVNMGSGLGGPEFLESLKTEQPTAKHVEDEAPKSSASKMNFNEPELVLRGKKDTTSPQKSTRSGTRFSDDTNMLKDFLSRAQARKQAKDTLLVANPAAAATASRRSPRKALASLDSNSPSPHKPGVDSDRAGTPLGRAKLVEVQLEEPDETAADASPVRRGTRKRLLAPAKTATGAPSFIPVRRADGTDPVVLQKSIAQELALVTRTNTRRNKGQAKPPALILKKLGMEEVEQETKGGHALRNCKSVGWDEKLVYYQDGRQVQADAEVEVKEKRPKARRLRGLGAGNGTPAPKRQVADLVGTNGTRASKT
ncbi:MAG: hypothetical protein Q9173_006743 [Seirophora scorigena]